MKALVFDGYTDEPACLGVPPYISPYARLAFGALSAAGAQVEYATIDKWRSGKVDLARFDLLAAIRNVAVPGKYLRGMPASDRELQKIGSAFNGRRALSIGPATRAAPAVLRDSFDHLSSSDFDASLFDLASKGEWTDRRRSYEEWNSWLIRGAKACCMHPDHGGPLIAEVQMYRGCVRYISGGCEFCVEPLFGGVVFRRAQDIVEEASALAAEGVRNLRLGAQSCVYCYMSEQVGKTETPKPNSKMIRRLLSSVRDAAKPEVFHVDNANPAVIAAHPEEAREVTRAIAELCTSGNVLAFGLESADPAVKAANNLNATADETLEAIRIVNEIGAGRGPSGLPLVLPGINFVCGLKGESKATYDMNLEFLRRVRDEGLMLRRINIRQVIPSRDEFPGVASRSDFERFRRAVREEIDGPMLERLVPERTVLKGVYPELREGGRTFGRQVGAYPLLVSIPYPVDLMRKVDVAVTRRGFRSVEGVLHPTDANAATLSMLQAIPGIGKKRAATIIRRRPFTAMTDLLEIFDDPMALESAQFHLSVGKVDKEQ